MKKNYLLILLFYTFSLNSQNKINFPNNPNKPKEPILYVPNDSNPKKEKELPKKKEANKIKKKLELKVKLFFCSKKSLEGNWNVEFEHFSFKHIHNQIHYHKNLALKDIKKIIFLNWKAKKIKNREEGTQYEFIPYSIEIFSNDNVKFNIKSDNLENFLNFNIKNKYGTTTQFSYWIDIEYKDKNWFSKLPIINKKSTNQCFNNVIKQIDFIQ